MYIARLNGACKSIALLCGAEGFIIKIIFQILLLGVVMPVISFDTLEYSKNLEAKGFTIQQAEALAMENKRVFNEFAENQLATKADLFAVKEELKTDIGRIDKELAVVKWVVFATFALVAVNVLKPLLA